MSEVMEDLATTDENVADLDQDVNFLFDEQIIQDERLFSLEQTADDVDDTLDLVNEEIDSKSYGRKQKFYERGDTDEFLHVFFLIYFCSFTHAFP